MSFEQLKELLTSTSVLKATDLDKYFIVFTDCYIKGLVGVLMQEGNMICYKTWNLKENEWNYETHDLEIVVVVHTLKVWRNYIMGRKFKIWTDHLSLK